MYPQLEDGERFPGLLSLLDLDLNMPRSTDIPPSVDFPIIADLAYLFDSAVRNDITTEAGFAHPCSWVGGYL